MNGKEVLTANEYRMIETIATGRSDKEAACYLNKAYSTFKNTKNKIFDKLGIPHNTSALVAWYYCIKNGAQLPELSAHGMQKELWLELFYWLLFRMK